MSKLVTALDVPTFNAALDLTRQVAPVSPWVKVGLELFTASPPGIVPELTATGAKVFLDLKFFDIPNTVAAAVSQACALGASMTTLHCLGGERMAAAALAARETAGADTLLIGVTLLTSMTGEDMAWFLPNLPGQEQALVQHMAVNARSWGLDGVVCSPKEVAAVREACGPEFVTVVPGIRPSAPLGIAQDDQRRTATPEAAVADGAHFLVVGRPIHAAPPPATPATAAADILAAMQGQGQCLVHEKS